MCCSCIAYAGLVLDIKRKTGTILPNLRGVAFALGGYLYLSCSLAVIFDGSHHTPTLSPDLRRSVHLSHHHSSTSSTSQLISTMLTAILRSVIPRSISSTSSLFGGINNVGARTSLASSFRTGSPLSLMGGSGVGQHQFREKSKSCLKTNKSASKRFIVRGKGRIKR